MARARGIETVVDGAHAYAHFPFRHADLECDYYGTSLHKWLLAPIGTGMLYVGASLQPAKARKALEAIGEVVRQVQREPIGEDELRRAKTKLLSRLVMSGESTNSRMLSLCGSWIALGRLETLDEEAAQIDAVTLDDLYRLRERVPLDGHQVTVTLGPVPERDLA